MSYIRTKDGRIIDTTKYPEHPASWSVQASDYALTIKQSENLEELCDEFVIEYLTSEEVIQIRYPEFQWAKEDFESNKKGTLYGAIRVAGKGLIYVAKMNDKGKLVLI